MRKWGPLLAVCLGTFMLVLDVTITLVALPDIAAQLHTTLSGISWVIDGYALALAAALLAMGTVADRHGLRRIYTLGLVAFTAASLACGLADSAPMLIAMRAVQGLGAAAMFATAISLLRATYSGRDLGAAMGVWAAVAGGAAALGPLIGGALTQAFGWSWIFYVNVPVGVLAIVLTLRVIPRSEVPESARRERLDLPGAVLFAAFAAGLLYATIAAHEGLDQPRHPHPARPRPGHGPGVRPRPAPQRQPPARPRPAGTARVPRRAHRDLRRRVHCVRVHGLQLDVAAVHHGTHAVGGRAGHAPERRRFDGRVADVRTDPAAVRHALGAAPRAAAGHRRRVRPIRADP